MSLYSPTAPASIQNTSLQIRPRTLATRMRAHRVSIGTIKGTKFAARRQHRLILYEEPTIEQIRHAAHVHCWAPLAGLIADAIVASQQSLSLTAARYAEQIAQCIESCEAREGPHGRMLTP